MAETQKEAEEQQRTLGIWSWVFVCMEAFFLILTAAMALVEADWEYFLLMGMGLLVLATLGIVMAIIGLTRQAEGFRRKCLVSAVTGASLLGIALVFTFIMANI